jgi:hypothetical protein
MHNVIYLTHHSLCLLDDVDKAHPLSSYSQEFLKQVILFFYCPHIRLQIYTFFIYRVCKIQKCYILIPNYQR